MLFLMACKKNIMNYKVEGNGEPLLFIHGLSDSLLYWELLASNLKDNYQIIRVDLRGHGESELGSDEISVDLYVDDLIGLLNELNVDKVNLIGFSLGGAIALDFAIRHPEMVCSLVVMSSFAKADDYLTQILNQFKSRLNNGFKDFYDFILPKVLCPDVIEENREELEFLREISSKNANVEAFIKAVDAGLAFDVEDKLSQITVPTLILSGKYDEIIPPYIQKGMQEKIKGSKMIIFDNARHNLLVGKNNEEILNILKNFYKKRKDE